METIKNRLKEKSTWTGIATLIISVATGFGITVAPELKESILQAVTAIAGVVLILTKAKGND
jgi:uncharacterized membrane protein